MIQMRDPRAAALSLVHYYEKLGSGSGLAGGQFSTIKKDFLRFVLWNNSWLKARDAGDIDIHVVRHEDLARDETAFMASIYDFLGLSLKDYPLVFPEKTAATHFRTGRIHEWKEVLDAETQAAMADVMRDIPCGY